MSSTEQTSAPHLPEKYVGWNDMTLLFDRMEHLPPDEISEAIGRDAAFMVGHIRAAAADHLKPIRVLDAGCGIGTMSVALLQTLLEAELDGSEHIHTANVQLDMFDISPSCVSVARTNIDQLVTDYGVIFKSLEINIFPGDWDDPELYSGLRMSGGYQVILFNPPYLAAGSNLALDTTRSGYKHVPKDAMYAGSFGLDGYRAGPTLFQLVTPEPGAGMITRYPIIRQTEIAPHVHPQDYYDEITDTVLGSSGYVTSNGLRGVKFDHRTYVGSRSGYWISEEYVPNNAMRPIGYEEFKNRYTK